MQIETRLSPERENLVLERMALQYYSADGVESIQHAQIWATAPWPRPGRRSVALTMALLVAKRF